MALSQMLQQLLKTNKFELGPRAGRDMNWDPWVAMQGGCRARLRRGGGGASVRKGYWVGEPPQWS